MHAVRSAMRRAAQSDKSTVTDRARWALAVLESRVRLTVESDRKV
jgi:hypothetical protein